MPCICKSNTQAAFVLGIFLATTSLIWCIFGDFRRSGIKYGDSKNILIGIISALIHGLLIIGANIRNSTLILVWMVFAILKGVFDIIDYVYVYEQNMYMNYDERPFEFVLFCIVCSGDIALLIWALAIAPNARKEIDNGRCSGPRRGTVYVQPGIELQVRH